MTEIPVEKRNVLILLSLSSFISVFNTCLTCLYKAMTCLHKIYVHAFIKHQCRLCNAYSFTRSCQCNPFETHSICDRASSGPALSDLMTLMTPQPSDRKIVPWESHDRGFQKTNKSSPAAGLQPGTERATEDQLFHLSIPLVCCLFSH